MARAVVPLNFNAFLEKEKLKDDGSNYTDWVRNLRIILIAAQKNYVIEVPVLSRKAWHTELLSSHQLCSARRS